MAHTPKPARRTLKRSRRSSDSARTITGRGGTILVEEGWTFAIPEASRARVVDLSKTSRPRAGRLDPLNLNRPN